MTSALRYLLPLGLLAYVFVVVILRAALHRRRTGASPIVVPHDDSAHGFIGRAALVLGFGIAIDIALFSASEAAYRWLAPIAWLENEALKVAALAVLVADLALIAVAQVQMGPSFRIGIDMAHSTDLVERGLYRLSRNPIYVGMMSALVALLFLLPNALTLLLVGVGVVLTQVQTRLEEEHLARLHGEQFAAYCRRVRRWL